MSQNKHVLLPPGMSIESDKTLQKLRKSTPFPFSFCNYFTSSHMKAGKGSILELSFSFTEYYKKQTYLGIKYTNKVHVSHRFLHSALPERPLYARKLGGCQRFNSERGKCGHSCDGAHVLFRGGDIGQVLTNVPSVIKKIP